MLRVICWFKAIPNFIKTGIWNPHVYKHVETVTGNLIISKDGMRLVNNYLHDTDESLIQNITVISYRCKCGGWKQDLICK